MVSKLSNRRVLILFALLLIVPLGILSKAYGGVGQQWVRDYSGDVLYEIFWCLFIFWFVQPRKNAIALRNITLKIALWVFAVTCIIEVSQLWFYLVPISLRSTFIWRMLLGAGFDWWDFPHYALGSLIGWGIIRQIGQIHYSR
ncbi:MAG: DUF2809 domain-containing protein [Cyanobacteria bacterium J06607_15]